MSEQGVYRQIISYLDQLFRDVGQLAVLIERLMGEEDFESLPSSGTRSSYRLTSNYGRSDNWRVHYITRCFVPIEEEQYASSIFYLIDLSSETIFDFPAMICGRLEHELMSENQIYNKVYLTDSLRTLAKEKPHWKSFADENGFTVAEPTFKTPITRVKGYILNLFDLSGRQQVIDNIINPLTIDDDDIDLDEILTIPKYRFCNLSDADLGIG